LKEFKTIVPFSPYRYRVYVLFTDSLQGSADNLANQGFLAKNHGISNDGTTGGFTVRLPNQSCTFVVLKYRAPINDIVHECYHAVCNMFKWIGAEHEEEVFAYHLDYLVYQILRDQEKTLKKIEKSLDKSKEV